MKGKKTMEMTLIQYKSLYEEKWNGLQRETERKLNEILLETRENERKIAIGMEREL